MNEALRAVRGALGADAMITEARNLSEDLGGGIEITTLRDGADGAEPVGTAGASTFTTHRAPLHPMDELREEMGLLRTMLGWLAPGLSHQDRFIQSLVSHGVTPENISKLLRAMEHAPAGSNRERCRHALAALLPFASGLQPMTGRWALVGPSGVGKTATMIKLTMSESQQRRRRVGWVNMDESTLAATDALEIYAAVLGVRLERATGRSELKIALTRLADCDLVLVDTPGTNPRSAESVAQLSKSLNGLADLRCLLLLSAVTNSADLIDWVNHYQRIGLHSLIFTKLDECRYLGPFLNTALSVGVPLSFTTCGRGFTDHLTPARPEDFTSLLLTGDIHDGCHTERN